MKNKILELIEFKKIDTLLDGFKKTTGLATAILNLDGTVLSHSEWRKLCADFYQKNPETSNWCSEIKIELAEKLADGENFHIYKCSNGLIELAIPILINGEHFANLFSGFFFIDEPDFIIFNTERKQYGFEKIKYNEALSFIPVIPLGKIKTTMEFLLGTIQFIVELALQKLNETELKESLAINKLLVENIIDNSPTLIYVANTEGKFKLVNKEFQKTFNIPKSEIIGKSRQEIMPGVIAEQHRNNDLEVIQTKKSIVTEEENIEIDGTHFYISQKFPLFDLNGEINAVGGISTDITEKKRTEEALLKSENKYKSLFENSADGILVLNEQSEILELNSKICEILGYKREDLILLKGYEFIHNEDLTNKDHAGALDKLQAGKTLLTHYRLQKKDGTYIPTELTTKMIGEGQFLNIVRDITERVLAEKIIQESETKYRSFFENSIDAILLTSTDGKIYSANPAACAMFDCSEAEIIQLGREGLSDSSDSRLSVLFDIRAKKGKVFGEITMLRKDRTPFQAEISSALFGNNDAMQYSSIIIRDISVRKQVEQSLQESEEKFKQIFLTSPDFVTISKIEDGTYVDVNDRLIQIFGYTREEIIGKTSLELNIWNNPEDREQMLDQIIKFGKVENLEASFKVKDGHILEGLLSASILLIKNKPHLLTITRDVTELRLAEKLTLETQSKLQSAIDSMTDAVFISDISGNFVEFNDAFATFHKFKNKVECAKTFSEYPDIMEVFFSNGELAPVEMWAVPRALRGETATNAEYTLKRKDTGETWVGSFSYNPIRDENDIIVGSVVVGRDITDQKVAEKAFKETAANLRSMIDNREDSIWSIDRDFNYIIFNSTYEEIINNEHGIELKKGMSSTERLSEEQANFWIPMFESVFAGESITFEFPHVLAGEKRYFRTSLNPIIEDNRITGASGLSIDITDIKLAEEALKLSEEKFEKSFRLSPYMVSLSTMEGEVLETNDRVFNTLGYTIAEFVGVKTTSIPLWVNPTERDNFIAILKQNKTLDNMEVQFRKKTGEIGDYLLSACVIELNDNNLVLSIIYDITERKLKEKALLESEQRYRDLFENSYAIMLLVDPESGNIVDANPAASQFYGWSNAELISMNLSKINTNSLEERKKILEEASESKKNHFFFNHIIADGSLHNVEVYSAPIYSKGKKLLYSIVHDITDRKEAEKALLNEKNLLSAIIENIPVMLTRYDPGTNMLYLNKEFEEKIGWKTEDLQTINLMEKVYPDPEYRAETLKYMESLSTNWKEFHVNTKAGDVIDSEWRNIRLDDGTQIGIGIDITEEKKAQAEIITLNTELETKVKLRTAQLEEINKELETFTYSVSHDLKAPLRGIDGYSKLLADIYKPDLNVEAQSFIEKIRISTLQMNQIIDDLLDYSRLERSQLNIGKIKIKDLIESVLSIYTTELEAGYFKINTKIKDIEIIADTKGFIIAFRNLIENAIKFTKGKSNPTIEIEIEEKELSWIISVNDNGIGFDMKYHHKIFDIFQRLQRTEDYPGTGIGLALVNKAMQRMHGNTWAESIPNVGSTFYLEIPKNQ